ncbi:MAG: hypothetical protein KatS3mg005_2081 [Bryobacteraceae bacterium]|nr:MAG: hypothetical protein KatS3mg005_2081 [Bryobacteraceae bacterium]
MKILGIILAVGAALAAQAPKQAASLAGQPRIQIKGVIEKVQIAPGLGQPFLEVRNSEGLHRVALGSMRYLMENNFNPKAGEQVVVRGYRLETEIVAATVELPGGKTVIHLRDENGYPLWRMGRYGAKKQE